MADLGFSAGSVIDGRYQLQSKLGEGGMGAVWRAQHISLKSPVAIKLINPSLASSEGALARFMLEAQSSAALRSSHIVQVFDFGVAEGVPYIAMEMLNGESLAERLDRERRLSLIDTARIMTEVSRAVALAHGAGVIHRDLKPDNIFLVKEAHGEIAKVLDFGIAKVTGGSFDATTDGGTKTGALIGTPHFVSPEQARGNKAVDLRSDLWALGVITYECVMGVRPFDSDGLGDLLMKICFEEPPPPSSQIPVPAGVDAWMQRALAKDPNQRFQSATSMFEAFTALLSQPGLALPPVAADPSTPAIAPIAPPYPVPGGIGPGTPDATPAIGAASGELNLGFGSPTHAGLETHAAPAALPRSKLGPLLGVAAVLAVLLGGGGLLFTLTRGGAPDAGGTAADARSNIPAENAVQAVAPPDATAEASVAAATAPTPTSSAGEPVASAQAATPRSTSKPASAPRSPAIGAAAAKAPAKPAAQPTAASPEPKPAPTGGLFDDRK